MDIFNPLTTFLRRMRANTHRDPTRDWFALLTLATLAFVCLVVWNIWAFDTVASGGTIGRAATSTPQAFNQSSVDAIHAIFEKRAAEEANYATGVYRFADPSQ